MCNVPLRESHGASGQAGLRGLRPLSNTTDTELSAEPNPWTGALADSSPPS